MRIERHTLGEKILGIAAASLLLALTQLGCQTSSRRFSDTLKHAPDFKLDDLEGKTVQLSQFRGKPVVLAFFAHGCGPCRAEAPRLSELARRHGADGVVVLAVNSWNEDERLLQKWATEEKLSQRILTYGREVNELYGFGGSVPAVVWINAQGVVVGADRGALGMAQLEDNTKRLLRAG